MDLRIVGAARPEEHEHLLEIARVLSTGLHFTGLPKAVPQAKPFIR